MTEVILVGEAFHGAKNFWEYKLDLIRQYHSKGILFDVGFEADELGMESLKTKGVVALFDAFPKIFKTKQVAHIIRFCLDNDIPFFGFDPRGRINPDRIDRRLQQKAKRYQNVYDTYFGTDEYFTIRDELMANTICDHVKESKKLQICLTANLHIKKNGSKENDARLRLKSIREYLDDERVSTYSISQHSKKGNYLGIDLSKRSYEINDVFCIENLAVPGEIIQIKSDKIDKQYGCYIFDHIRESDPACESYDEMIIHNCVSKPDIMNFIR